MEMQTSHPTKTTVQTILILAALSQVAVMMEDRYHPTHNPASAADHHHPTHQSAPAASHCKTQLPIPIQIPMKTQCMLVQNSILLSILIDAQSDLWAGQGSIGQRSELCQWPPNMTMLNNLLKITYSSVLVDFLSESECLVDTY
jgi:hypothetical protein